MIDKWHLDHLCGISSLGPVLGAGHIPARRLVAARRALKRDPSLAEMQQRIVTVETAQELPNLVGDHCTKTPFQVPARYDDRSIGLVPGRPAFRERNISREMPRMRSNA